MDDMGYHGNPQPSFFRRYNPYFRDENLHFSWFWGPRVVIYQFFRILGLEIFWRSHACFQDSRRFRMDETFRIFAKSRLNRRAPYWGHKPFPINKHAESVNLLRDFRGSHFWMHENHHMNGSDPPAGENPKFHQTFQVPKMEESSPI